MLICNECEYVFPDEEKIVAVNEKIEIRCPKCKSDDVSMAIRCVICKKYHSADECGYLSGICEECAENDFTIGKFKAYCETKTTLELADFFLGYCFGICITDGDCEELIEYLKKSFFRDYEASNIERKIAMMSIAWEWVKDNISEYCEWRLDYDG